MNSLERQDTKPSSSINLKTGPPRVNNKEAEMKVNWLKLLVSLVPLLVAADEAGDKNRQDNQQDNQQDNEQDNHQVSYPFGEQLDITPLPRNHVFTSFTFNLESEPMKQSSQRPFTNYRAFPRSLASILDTTYTRELHLRFGQGWWDSEHWGQLPDAGESAGGVGVEVWAVIEAENAHEGFKQWLTLVNSLSGLFCASLNFIDSAKTVFPLKSFAPTTEIPLFNPNNTLFLLRAALPSEPVCTENLTPFVKFLPTRGKAGLASLLDGHRVFESEWHMMSIDIETRCETDACNFSMSQKVNAVLDVARVKRRIKNPIPRPLAGGDLKCDPGKPHDAFQCFALNQEQAISFTLDELFGRSIKNANLLSKNPGKVCVHAPPNWDVFLSLEGNFFGTGDNCFDLKEQANYDVHVSTENATLVKPIQQAPVLVSRSLTGYGLDKGGLRTVFTNNLESESRLIYLETLPWFMRIYLHTLTVTGADQEDVLKSIYYQPEVDRERPTHLEFELILPPKSTIAISYQFDKSLLLIAEYPPDANHGFSVEPGMVTVIEPQQYRARTSPALLTLPTPDFSMPYNVIIFTATVMSLTFGTIFNLLFKRVLIEEEAEIISAEFDLKVRVREEIVAIRTKIICLFSEKDTQSIQERITRITSDNK
jgi:phosphatidylinositol glycan class T